MLEEKGKAASGPEIYCAAKTLAERAAWDFVEEHKGEISFDLAVVNPPFVRALGPSLIWVLQTDQYSQLGVWCKSTCSSPVPTTVNISFHPAPQPLIHEVCLSPIFAHFLTHDRTPMVLSLGLLARTPQHLPRVLQGIPIRTNACDRHTQCANRKLGRRTRCCSSTRTRYRERSGRR